MYSFNTIEEALDDLRAGRLILATDDPDRENEIGRASCRERV